MIYRPDENPGDKIFYRSATSYADVDETLFWSNCRASGGGPAYIMNANDVERLEATIKSSKFRKQKRSYYKYLYSSCELF